MAVACFVPTCRWPKQANGTTFDAYHGWMALSWGISLANLPAMTVPCGLVHAWDSEPGGAVDVVVGATHNAAMPPGAGAVAGHGAGAAGDTTQGAAARGSAAEGEAAAAAGWSGCDPGTAVSRGVSPRPGLPLPVGLQLVGRPGGEAALLAAAAAFERAHTYHDLVPLDPRG